jgi:hypothetical protein
MGYVVEVPVTDENFVGQMNRMRAWLDHRHIEPNSFTLSYAGAQKGVRVLFAGESDAAAFAEEFGGTPRSAAASDSVAA